MLSQIEAPQTHAAIINAAATSTPVSITATVNGSTITCAMPTPVAGVTVSGSTVTTTPGTYDLTFTLANSTFSNGVQIGLLSVPNLSVVSASGPTTATVTVTNSLQPGSPSASCAMTFNLAGISIDPTLVNTADPTPMPPLV